MTYFLIGLCVFYKRVISPFLKPACRFYPTCSVYGREALEMHGLSKGFLLLLRRILRCHPWGGSGIDLVPSFEAKDEQKRIKEHG